MGIILGSVATKLVAKLTFIPLILVGNRTPNSKILLAFDGSENAAGVIEFVGVLLGGFDYEVSFLHVIRSDGEGQPEYQHIFSSKEYTRAVSKEMVETLKAAQTKWIDMGLKTDKVST